MKRKSTNWIFLCLSQILAGDVAAAFVPHSDRSRRWTIQTTSALHDKRLEREINERSFQNAKRGGAGETAAGAVLGGLLLGPFGALFGASIGSNIGARNAFDRARKEEMEKLGVTQEMLDAAEDIGRALERSNDGLQASRDSLETLQRFARNLDAEANAVYEKAKLAIAESNEDAARKYLLDRTRIQEKLKQVLKQCADEKRRYEQMESNVAALEQRAMEINALLRRAVGAKTIQDANSFGLGLSAEDPLLQKFRDAGIE